MGFLYSSDQQRVLNKTVRNELLTLKDVEVILNDVNQYKLSQNPDTDFKTFKYKVDKELINKYVSEKYSDSIYFLNNNGIINRLYF